jgi:hypothetical protein
MFPRFIRQCTISDENITTNLIALLLQLPFSLRRHVEDSILLIGLSSQECDFSALLLSFLERTLPSADHFFTAGSLASKWIKSSGSSAFMMSLGPALLPCLSVFHPHRPDIVALFAKLLNILIICRHLIFDSSVDAVFTLFVDHLVEDSGDETVFKMKTSILKTIRTVFLSVFEKWKSIEESIEWRAHFQTELLPPLIESVFIASTLPVNDALSTQLFHMNYLFLCFEIRTDQFLNELFFNSYVISAAKLSQPDLDDFEMNPEQFIAFSESHTDIGFLSKGIFLPNSILSLFFLLHR